MHRTPQTKMGVANHTLSICTISDIWTHKGIQLTCISTHTLRHQPLVQTVQTRYDRATLKSAHVRARNQKRFPTRLVLSHHCLLALLNNSRPASSRGRFPNPENS